MEEAFDKGGRRGSEVVGVSKTTGETAIRDEVTSQEGKVGLGERIGRWLRRSPKGKR